MIEKHRITLMGDRIGHGKISKVGAFLLSPDVQTVAATTLFQAVVRSLCLPTPTLTKMFVSMITDAVVQGGISWMLRRKTSGLLALMGVSKKVANDKAINTKPGKNTPPSDPEWLFFSLIERSAARKSLCLYSGMASAFLLSDLLVFKSAIQFAISGSFAAVCLAREGRRYYRASKVLDGSWVIEDKGPPPKRAPAREKIKKFFGIFSPVPSPAASRA